MADDEEGPPTPMWFMDKEAVAPGPFNEDGLPHGKGVMKYPPPPAVDEDEDEKPGDTFDGKMVNGKREGEGTYTWSHGAVYQGPYVDNKKHGKAKLTMPNKSFYEGEFVEDHMQGSGRYVYGNGDIYEGHFKAGKREGPGMYHYKDVGCQLVGEWAEGSFTKGRWVLKDGSMFHGSFDKALSPVEGAHYFTRTHLLQAGNYKTGTWQSPDQPKLGEAAMLAKLAEPTR